MKTALKFLAFTTLCLGITATAFGQEVHGTPGSPG